VCTEEGVERSNLVPAYKHLRLRVSKEATDVGYGRILGAQIPKQPGELTSSEGHACDAVGKYHLGTNVHVLPGTKVIACPHGTKALRSGIE
jgi:hypothetical protein